MRVLLDTNVLIAAFISRGVCSELFEHCLRQHRLVTCSFILNELQEKLRTKFKYDESTTSQVLDLLRSGMELVEPIPLNENICRDPDDDHILAAAVAAHCDCIVTGDQDLLVLGQHAGVRILSPAEFWPFEAHMLLPKTDPQ
ncbi:MAG: putative toxin-antitoxin system toxin component, PIN family [Pseudomonadota bacterium]